MAAELSGVEGRQMERAKKQIRTTPDCAAWADHYQSDAKVRKTYQMCVCVCDPLCLKWRVETEVWC